MAIRRNGNDGSDALEPIRGDSGATNTGDET